MTQSRAITWIQPHLRPLSVLRKVVDSCFGFVLDPDYEMHIMEFKAAWEALVLFDPENFTFHYKVHVLTCHVPEFVKRHGPLGPYSEQAGESLHSRWASHFKRFKNLPNKSFGERMLMALVDFNYQHLSLIDQT